MNRIFLSPLEIKEELKRTDSDEEPCGNCGGNVAKRMTRDEEEYYKCLDCLRVDV